MAKGVELLLQRGRRDEAFEKIMELYETKVFALVLSIVGNAARAEEVAQDSFVKVWQALDLYDGRAALGTWIYTIARNTALTHLRAEKYRQTAPLDAAGEPVAVGKDASDQTAIEHLVARLPEEQREVVALYYYQEKSVEETAAMLDLPEGTVKSHLFRARKKLGEWMKRGKRP